jgi:hypothetical protein
MATTTPSLGIQSFFSTTVAAPVVATDTIIYLNSLPTPSQGFLVLNLGGATQEVIFYTSKGANYVQCTSVADGRGQDGTSAAAHAAGESAKMTVTAGYWQALQNMTGVTAGAVGAIPFATGWTTMPAVTPNTVTYNGNRSYSVVFNSTDLTSYISNGMRLKLTRTVTAPTQCTSLNGTTQYYSKTSPAGMTFTNNFTVSAWVKLSSYAGANMMIMSRLASAATNGWYFSLTSAGQPQIGGVNASVDRIFRAYQSIPLNKWVHLAATLDMATPAANIYIDGVLVPSSSVGGAATSVSQSGDLCVGAFTAGGQPFPGKIAQAAVFSAVIAQATIQSYISQGLAGTETSLISAYSFNGVITDLNANANNLTANGSAVATNADSPFAQDDTGTPTGTTDCGIVTAKVFSTNTTLTVQVPEGCAIPTSGGVSALSYSTQASPYGFPAIARFRLSAWDTSGTLTNPLATSLTKFVIEEPFTDILYSNPGVAGGTYLLSQRGTSREIKGRTGSIATGTGAISFGITWPVGFFGNIYHQVSTPSDMTTLANQFASIASLSTSVGDTYVTSPGGAATSRVNFSAAGTY